MIVTQNTKLNIVPGGILPVVHVSQYDVDRVLSFTLYDGNGAASIESGTTVTIEGTKPDGNGFQYAGTLSENVVTVNTTVQMTALEGTNECKLTLKKGTQTIGSALFLMEVEKAGINENTPVSETDLPLIITQATEQMERAEAAAANAENSEIIAGSAMRMAVESATICTSILPIVQQSAEICASILPVVQSNAESAETNALKSEGYAVGKQNGVDVGSDSPYYHNSSEYWARYAQQYAEGGIHYKTSIYFANIPTTGMIVGDMYDIKDDFTTDSRFADGAGIPCKAGTNIIWNANNLWDIDIQGSGAGGEIISYDDYSQLTPEQQASGDYYIPDYPVTASTMPVAGFDTTPTQGSFAPVTSDGIYRAIQPISGSIQSIGGRVSDIEDEIGNEDISSVGSSLTGAIANLGDRNVSDSFNGYSNKTYTGMKKGKYLVYMGGQPTGASGSYVQLTVCLNGTALYHRNGTTGMQLCYVLDVPTNNSTIEFQFGGSISDDSSSTMKYNGGGYVYLGDF